MPEGDSIHGWARRHGNILAGRKASVTSPQGRFADEAATLDGKKVKAVIPHGKHLFYSFTGGRQVHLHMGMRGMMREHLGRDVPDPVGQIRLRVKTSAGAVDVIGPAVCDLVDDAAAQEVRDGLGPDVLAPDFDIDEAAARLRSTGRAAGVWIVDQNQLAGPGNVFRSEALYLAKINPRTPGRDLSKAHATSLVRHTKQLMQQCVDRGEMITRKAAGRAMKNREDQFYVYRRETAADKGARVERLPMGGQDVYWCPDVQVH
jgi:endonuclease-8